ALHAYQWFWLRGSTLLTAPDILFWSTLAACLIFQTAYESFAAKRPKPRALFGPQTSLVIRTVCTFIVICTLWSLWGASSFDAWTLMLGRSGLLPVLAGESDEVSWAKTLLSAGVLTLMTLVAAGVDFGFARAPVARGLHAKAQVKPRGPSPISAHPFF